MAKKMKKRKKKKGGKVNIDKYLTKRNAAIMAVCLWLIPSPLN